MKKFFLKKQLKAFLLALFLFAGIILVSACSYSDLPDTPDNGEVADNSFIDGFKLNYKPDFFEVDDFYLDFSTEIVKTLGNVFGRAEFEKENVLVDGYEFEVIPFIYQSFQEYLDSLAPEDRPLAENIESEYEKFEDSKRIYFVDDIRNSVYLEQEDPDISENTYLANGNSEQYSWKWTHKIEADNTHGYELQGINVYAHTVFAQIISAEKASDVFDHASLPNIKNELENYYFHFFPEIYAPALQVAILEILLDRTPTVFSFDFERDVVLPDAKSILGDGISQGLKYEYQKHAEYMGISQSDKQDITKYLIENVIGTHKILEQDNYIKQVGYEYLINKTIWEGALKEYFFSNPKLEMINNPTLGSIYDTYPTTTLIDFPSNKMFVSSGLNAFSHLPKGEIRSVVLMPSKVDHLFEMWFYLVADRVFNVNLHYRYYDAETNTLHEGDSESFPTIIESQFNHIESNYVGMNFTDENYNLILYKTSKFNNEIGNGILKATQAKKMNYALSKFFEPSEKGGFGLNHKKFEEDQSSFFEIVFSVPKTQGQENLDYTFKFGMLSLMFAPEDLLD